MKTTLGCGMRLNHENRLAMRYKRYKQWNNGLLHLETTSDNGADLKDNNRKGSQVLVWLILVIKSLLQKVSGILLFTLPSGNHCGIYINKALSSIIDSDGS